MPGRQPAEAWWAFVFDHWTAHERWALYRVAELYVIPPLTAWEA